MSPRLARLYFATMDGVFGKPNVQKAARTPDAGDPGARKAFGDALKAGSKGGQQAATFSKGALALAATTAPMRPNNAKAG